MPVYQDGDAVRQREYRIHVVLDQQNGDLAFELAQQIVHVGAFGGTQPGHRLVEQQQPRTGGQRDRQLELLLLAVRYLADRNIGAMGKPDAVQEIGGMRAQRPVLARVRPEAKTMSCAGLDGERDVVEGGIVVEQLGDLERARQAAPDAGRRRKAADLVICETDSAEILDQLAGNLQHQRRLACPVRADDGVQLVRANVERQVAGGDQAAEALYQSLDAKQRPVHRRLIA